MIEVEVGKQDVADVAYAKAQALDLTQRGLADIEARSHQETGTGRHVPCRLAQRFLTQPRIDQHQARFRLDKQAVTHHVAVIIETLANQRRAEGCAVEVVDFHGLQDTTFAIVTDPDDKRRIMSGRWQFLPPSKGVRSHVAVPVPGPPSLSRPAARPRRFRYLVSRLALLLGLLALPASSVQAQRGKDRGRRAASKPRCPRCATACDSRAAASLGRLGPAWAGAGAVPVAARPCR